MLVALVLLVLAHAGPASACARFMWTTADNATFTGRIMDANNTQHESIWALPAGIPRAGAHGTAPGIPVARRARQRGAEAPAAAAAAAHSRSCLCWPCLRAAGCPSMVCWPWRAAT